MTTYLYTDADLAAAVAAERATWAIDPPDPETAMRAVLDAVAPAIAARALAKAADAIDRRPLPDAPPQYMATDWLAGYEAAETDVAARLRRPNRARDAPPAGGR